MPFKTVVITLASAFVAAASCVPSSASAASVDAGAKTFSAAAAALAAQRWDEGCHEMRQFFDVYGSADEIPQAYVDAMKKAGFTGAEGTRAVQGALKSKKLPEACGIAYMTVLMDLHERNAGEAATMLRQANALEQRLAGSSQTTAVKTVATTASRGGGATGPIPTGQYHCYSGVGWDAFQAQPGVGGLVSPQFEGYLWIYDAHTYANMKPDDKGTYELQGNHIIAHSGPWVRVDADLHYARDGVYHQPTIFFGYKDVPSIHFACTPGH